MKINLTNWFVHNNTLLIFRQGNFDAIWNTTRELDQRIFTNQSTETPAVDGPLYGPVAFITLAVVLTTIALVTTVSNLLIIVAFMWNKKLRKLTNYFYVSLAFSDFIAGLFDMAPGIWEALMGYENWRFGKIACITWLVVDYWIYTASTYTMLAICIDRYMAILHGLRYRRKRTHGLVMTMIVSCWLLAFLTEVPGIVFWEYWMGESIIDYSYYCDVEWSKNETYAMVNTLLTMLLPFVFILFLSFAIWIVLRRRARFLRGESGSVSLTTSVARNKFQGKSKDKDNKLRSESEVFVSTISGSERSLKCLDEADPTKHKPTGSATIALYHDDDIGRAENYIDVAAQTDLSFNEFRWKMTGDIYCDLIATCDKSVWTKDIDDEGLIENRHEGSDANAPEQGVDNPAFAIDARKHADSTRDDGKQNKEDCSKGNQMKRGDVSMKHTVDKHRSSKDGKGSGFLASSDVSDTRTASSELGYQQRKRAVTRKLDSGEGNLRRLNTSSSTNFNRLAGDRRAVMSFGILMGTFLVLWTPWFVIAVIESVCSETCVMGDEVYYLSAWLIYLNSMINPFIYVFRDAEFKHSVCEILQCLCCRSGHPKQVPRLSYRSRDKK
ncbi:muscarinic acetylcholine receptor M2-like [Ptychodera flava]|uniref:muscarinic acetylcholine receptor M2-like n=1 Tax=Ptychodera flava TaxID=63121 RepID=UPI003969F9BE